MNKSQAELIGIFSDVESFYLKCLSLSETARKFQTSPGTIRHLLVKHGYSGHLGKPSTVKAKYLSMSAEQIATVRGEYTSGYPRSYFVEKYQIGYNSVGHFLKACGCYTEEFKKWSHYSKQSVLYKNPLSSDDPIKWYLVGYILGDGSVDTVRKRLNICSSDKTHLQTISDLFGVNSHIHVRGDKVWYTMETSSWEVLDALISLGFCSNKSNLGMALPKVPAEYFGSFLLGLLDSDGTLHLSTGARGATRLSVDFLGHPSYIYELFTILREKFLCSCCSLSAGRNSPLASLSVAAIANPGFYSFLYSSSPISLERKRRRYEKWNNYYQAFTTREISGIFIDEEYHNHE